MKAKLNAEPKPQAFRSFTMEITVETVDEARLFYHVFNHSCLDKKIAENWYSQSGGFSRDYAPVSGNLGGDGLYTSIGDEIRSQGFKV